MNNEEPNTPKPTNPKPRPVAPFAHKKVFDVVRPGKAPASPTSRPVITGHKPPVKDDQLVQKGEGAYTTNNPFDKHGLMSHKTDLQFDTSDIDEPEAEQERPAEKPAPTSTPAPADAAKPAMSDHDPELEAALAELTGKSAPTQTKSFEVETPAAPAEDTPTDAQEEMSLIEDAAEPEDETPTETPYETPTKETEPEQDEPETEPEPELPAPKTSDTEETSDLTPDQLASLPKPKAQDRDLATAAKAAQQAAEEFGEYNPNRTLDVDELPQLGPDDVVAATGAPQIDHAFVVQHKTKTQWWEWLIIGAMIVILALVALNFLLDAGVIKPGVNLPHTHLINKG